MHNYGLTKKISTVNFEEKDYSCTADQFSIIFLNTEDQFKL